MKTPMEIGRRAIAWAKSHPVFVDPDGNSMAKLGRQWSRCRSRAEFHPWHATTGDDDRSGSIDEVVVEQPAERRFAPDLAGRSGATGVIVAVADRADTVSHYRIIPA